MSTELDILAEILKENKTIIPDFVRYKYKYGYNELMTINDLRKDNAFDKEIRLYYTHVEFNIDICVVIKRKNNRYEVLIRLEDAISNGEIVSLLLKDKTKESLIPIIKNSYNMLKEKEEKQVDKVMKKEEEEKEIKDFFLRQVKESND